MALLVRPASRLAMGLFTLGSLALGGGDRPSQSILRGHLVIHDPSVARVGQHYVAFWTGDEHVGDGAPRIKTSRDGRTWTDAGTLQGDRPRWIAQHLDTYPPNLWAPHVFERQGTYYLYYSASLFGKNTSAIGLAVNRHFDPRNPGANWEDKGLVVASREGDNFNAIDAARLDTPDGRAWLAFGSFWDGIKMRELDPVSGKLKSSNPTLYSLASRGGGPIEAPSLLRRGGYYYLFTSFDKCCSGLFSTYRIMVGRSKSVTGPYVDKRGTPLLAGGGTELQAMKGRFIGPGGQEVYRDGDRDMLAYHYYDGDDAGVPKLQVSTIRWSADGWPSLDPLPNGGE
ncbi:arabinan endo-1,5-alpha-L-arabinosidase [Deinococcus peraridilitoris]|uniref:Beta-xylosidase n=1 Tax=Deinococcus peraridilitoris (strain DSM 19664 / LMG 22246 / CIP 109416 / KR-200) TaxID=937777 RepID=K9ZXM1_DEIPD|nr:arabinan endo-1,5-alpha-L-arabinosidase [Deinococcus peraridilitoris]AFZ66341.1 beta-xylosidase [Deinococcus peraridilitoris DSM 19664]